MIYSVEYIVQSIAAMLASVYPDVPVYDANTMQGAEYPCFFVFLMPSNINDQIDGIDMREIAFDVVYVQERNAPNANARIYGIADTLDELFDTVQYTDGTDTIPLHTHDRSYSIEDQELHYKLTLRQRVGKPRSEPLIMTMENNVYVEEGD